MATDFARYEQEHTLLFHWVNITTRHEKKRIKTRETKISICIEIATVVATAAATTAVAVADRKSSQAKNKFQTCRFECDFCIYTPKDKTTNTIAIHSDSNGWFPSRYFLPLLSIKCEELVGIEKFMFFLKKKRWEKRLIYLLNSFCKFYLRNK